MTAGPGHILKRHETFWQLLGELLEGLGKILGGEKSFLEGLEDDDRIAKMI